MPNWCYNTLRVEGDTKTLDKFIKANMGYDAQFRGPHDSPAEMTEKYFCFNALYPVPDKILAVGFDGSYRFDTHSDNKNAIEFGRALPDGYNWCSKMWGTKWDIYWDRISEETIGFKEGDTEITIQFSTAWAPPIPWLKKVAKMFSNLSFSLQFEEEGTGWFGKWVCENGKISYQQGRYEYEEEEWDDDSFDDEDDED